MKTDGCGCGCEHGPGTMTIGGKGQLTGDERVGDIAARAGALAVLERLGVNHCCGAHMTLREAAAAAGITLDGLLAALREAGVAR